MIIIKIRKPFLTAISFLPDEGFVWLSKVSQQGYSQPAAYSADFDFSDVNQTPVTIGAVFFDDVEYQGVPSVAACRLIEKSFFFNAASQELYVHMDHSKRPDSSSFDSLQIVGYTNESVFYDENDVEHLPYVDGGFNLNTNVDRFVFSKLSLIGNTLSLKNTYDATTETAPFDFMIDSTVSGADVNILYISSDDLDAGLTTLTPIYTGYIIDTSIDTDTLNITLEDKRGQLNIKVPNEVFDITTYPNIEDKLIDETIPEGYGDLNNAPGFCVNGTVKTGDVLYKYATDGTSLTTVQVEEDDVWTTVTPSASSSTACTFTLSTGDGRDSSGNPLDARVIARLRDFDNPADIIVDLINRTFSQPFISEYYDIVTWGDERALLDDIYLYMADRQEFFKYIEELQNVSTLPFKFDIEASGKYIIRVNDITRAVSQNITYIDNINDSKTIETDFTQYATDVRILYNKDLASEKEAVVTRDDFKTETFDKYRFLKELEFSSNLANSTLANDKALNALKEYKLARSLYTLTINCIQCFQLLDVITFDNSVYIKGAKIREYSGERKIKISSISMDFDNNITTLQGYDISDITSKGTELYSQGQIFNLYANNYTTHGRSQTYQPPAG